jgi:uncharacterized membrane protein
MNTTALTQTLALGAATGMRCFSGPAFLALKYGGPLKTIVPVMAAGEMIADKTPYIGNRIDSGPLAGRAVMGAVVGAVIAREHDEPVSAGMLLGAVAAVVTAHLAYQVRRRMPVHGVLAGLAEDALVVGICGSRAAAGR